MKTLKIFFFFIILMGTSLIYADTLKAPARTLIVLPLTIENNTNEYTFYFISGGQTTKIEPGKIFSINLGDHTTTQITFDYDGKIHATTPWHTSGLGNGGVSFSQDPGSGQANFNWSFGPASISPDTHPPTFTITGGINVSGTDIWSSGISLQPHGSCTATTVTITE